MKVVSILVVAKVNNNLDLAMLQKNNEGSQLSPGDTRLGMRLHPSNIYVAFFKSGKFLIYGIPSIDLIKETVQRVRTILENSGMQAQLQSVEVANITLTDQVHLGKSLEQLFLVLKDTRAYYEPEQFPGLVYKDEDGLSFLVFSTGKMVITGVKNLSLETERIEEFKSQISS